MNKTKAPLLFLISFSLILSIILSVIHVEISTQKDNRIMMSEKENLESCHFDIHQIGKDVKMRMS